MPSLLGSLLVLALATGTALGQTFTGSNPPGGFRDFVFSTGPGATNLAIWLSGNATAFSDLLLKKGAVPGDSDYDFIALGNGQTNAINLESPEFTLTNYVLRVRTPTNSATHDFTLTVSTNVSGMRTLARPATKSLVARLDTGIEANSWQYFRVDAPTNLPGWRVVLYSTNTSVTPDLYIQRNQFPTNRSALKLSTNQNPDTLTFTNSEAVAGRYFVGVYEPGAAVNYSLAMDFAAVTTLTWDPGTDFYGTQVYTNHDTTGGDYYFRIVPQNTALGAWRTALNVVSGEANLYLAKGRLPTPTNSVYKSERVGSDGFVVPADDFNSGEDWYLLVRATPGAQWTLVTGEPFVTDLGTVATDASSGSGNVTVGAEGMRFFKTVVPVNTGAWRLWLNGLTNTILVRIAGVPVPSSTDLSQDGQMLVVPNYLLGGQLYFVGVAGDPGSTVNLDSRQQAVTDIAFISNTPVTASGYGYATFRVQVPTDQLAWQASVVVSSGNANIAVRRNLVPNEGNNDAYSEVASNVTDSVTLVPPSLTDGTFYITVYGTNGYSCTLQSGNPEVTEINFVGATTNTDVNRVGWRFFKVSDINSQLGALGWDLFVTNFAPGTRIALRRNSAPSVWNYRNPTAGTSGYYDFISAADYLQRPGHQADVWYVGVFNTNRALGNFTLVTRALTADPLAFDGGSAARANLPAGKWQFFRVDIPSNLLGWDLRLVNVQSNGTPQLVVRREALPVSLANIGFSGSVTGTNWPTGNQWAAGADWSARTFTPDGKYNENGRVLTMGYGSPLEAGTYYVGVMGSAGATNPVTYTLLSRGIGTGYQIPVQDVAYAGGAVTNIALAARDIAVYRVLVNSNAPSWKIKLAPTSGDVLMAIAKDHVPNITAAANGSVTNLQTAGKKMTKTLNEHFVQIPLDWETNLLAGTYYVLVESEGLASAANPTWIGSGQAAYWLKSFGPLLEIDLGMLVDADITYDGALEGGEAGAFHFHNLPDTLGFELSLENKVGNPVIVSSPDLPLANPGSASPSGGGVPLDIYGNEGGQSKYLEASTDFITVSDPGLDETIMIKARAPYDDATYRLRIRKLVPQQLAFDGGAIMVTNQSHIYEFFKVEVPTNALGWDIRVKDVTAGSPQLIVGRDFLPLDIVSTFPGQLDFWPSGFEWLAAKDWTQRSLSSDGVSEDGRILAMGMGQPLEPGTYYVGVKNDDFPLPASYTIYSRGIGPGFVLPVRDLPFAGGAITNDSLAPREADYYRVVVPTNATSWKAKVVTQSGEALLLVLTNHVPSVQTGRAGSVGRVMQKTNYEQYVMLPVSPEVVLAPGTNYLAVAGEGVDPNGTRIGTGVTSYYLESDGQLQPVNMGIVGEADLVQFGNLQAGEVQAYQFSVPPGISNLEARLLDVTGNPAMVLRCGTNFPNPGAASTTSGAGSVAAESYGNDGGYAITTALGNANTNLIRMLNPTNGVYTLMVKARGASANSFSDASYTLVVRAVTDTNLIVALDFDGGMCSVTNQSGSWRFFQIEVPTNALGWDVRLTNVTSGMPKMVVRRDILPTSLAAPVWSQPWLSTNWPSTNQWAAGADWTQLQNSNSGTNEDGRILAMGMGQPLQPGTYYVGVTNSSGTNALSYTFVSRGIGDGMSIPVVDLNFSGGNVSSAALPPRVAAYYRVNVLSNTPDWKLDLTATLGESMLVILKDHVPSVGTGTTTPTTQLTGKSMNKAGNEHYLLEPASPQTNGVSAGTYYIAVVGEGVNPGLTTSPKHIGTDVSSYSLNSVGVHSPANLGPVGPTDLVSSDALEGGESRLYQFDVPAGTPAVELRLENRIGNPVMSFVTNVSLPDPGGLSSQRDAYGNDGGVNPSGVNSNILTVANPAPGTYTVAVKARNLGAGVYPDANYTLRVRVVPVPELNFASELNGNGLVNTVSGQLLDNQRAYFKFVIPDSLEGRPILGWQLDLSQLSGLATLRVRKDLLPNDSFTTGMPFTPNAAVIAPPFLTNGTWYVEVRGSNSTSFTLTSSALTLQRPAWVMPAPGQPTTTPGLTAPQFGDSGLDTNGVPLPEDQGIDLQQGRYHYYAVVVPDTNGGLLRVQMDDISGNADVYMRIGQVPTASHATNGASGVMYQRSLTGNVTEYANWVPLNGQTESSLTPGIWYLAVKASGGANARYRLRVSTGQVQDLDLAGGSANNQLLVGGDWRYYRLQLPEQMPANWQVTFSQILGDVVMYLRDTVPPGNGATTNATDIKDWASDKKNTGPYQNYDAPGTYALTVPPVRPGSVYYLGFRAKNDATFSVSSAVSGATNPPLPEIAFYGGTVTTNLDPYGQMAFVIRTPGDALRWRNACINASYVRFYLDNGALPSKTTSDDWASTAANATLDKFLTGYPWLASQTFYLIVTNTSSVAQPFTFSMQGSNTNADDDMDGLPDVWEIANFGSLSQSPNGDFDGDGVSNLSEFVEGTDPGDKTSLRPRLTVTASNGSAAANPASTNYDLGTVVAVTATPNPGFNFLYWSGQASGSDNPLLLTLTSNVTINAVCKWPGDDFAQRVPIGGWSVAVSGVNSNATKEPREPNHAGYVGGHSLWWTWTAPASGDVTVATTGSSFNTLLAVYTGAAITNLSLVASNDNDGANVTSKLTFTAVAGTPYAIAVDGYANAVGQIQLQVLQPVLTVSLGSGLRLPDGSFQFTLTAPPGTVYDIFASVDLSGWDPIGTVTNTTGTIQFVDPDAVNFDRRFYRAVAH